MTGACRQLGTIFTYYVLRIRPSESSDPLKSSWYLLSITFSLILVMEIRMLMKESLMHSLPLQLNM